MINTWLKGFLIKPISYDYGEQNKLEINIHLLLCSQSCEEINKFAGVNKYPGEAIHIKIDETDYECRDSIESILKYAAC